MKLIAHRGNTEGPNPLEENKPEYIEQAIENGFDVEIDIWYITQTKQFFLGHNKPEYLITLFWLASILINCGFIVRILMLCMSFLLTQVDIIIFGMILIDIL